MSFCFTKMHGLGNDFVVVNAISQSFDLQSDEIRLLSNRRTGIGFDQLLVVEAPRSASADFYYRIFNANGTEVGQCGNGARCVGLFIEQQQLSNQSEWVLQTQTASMRVESVGQGQYRVHLPVPHFTAEEIPLNQESIVMPGQLEVAGELISFAAVNVGNPHMIIEVDSIHDEEAERLGSGLSIHPLFAEGVNVSFVRRQSREHIMIRVYERGVGLTLACGSAACAAVAVGVRQKKLASRVLVEQRGGALMVSYLPDCKSFFQEGGAESVFQGQWLSSSSSSG